MKSTEFVGIFAPLVLLGGLACRGPATAQQIQEWNEVVDRARTRVMEVADLDDFSRETVRTNQPRFIIPHIPFGNDHTFEWAISSNRTAQLRGYGNYRDLSDGPVRCTLWSSTVKFRREADHSQPKGGLVESVVCL